MCVSGNQKIQLHKDRLKIRLICQSNKQVGQTSHFTTLSKEIFFYQNVLIKKHLNSHTML